MKNIYVLPTEKPSRLYQNYYGKYFEICELPRVNTIYKKCYNIYITSDEEIKEGDWCLNEDDFDKHLLFKADSLFFDTGLEAKKIILTTDQDLIKDGVQAIDDEFLEWFVKNPSCEEVEVEKEQYHTFVGMKKYPMIPNYKIIIPKEEPKQEKLEYGLLQHIKLCLECNNESQAIRLLEKYGFEKQEQDKNKYSEEEVLEILNEFSIACYSPIEKFEIPGWFEQFKKK